MTKSKEVDLSNKKSFEEEMTAAGGGDAVFDSSVPPSNPKEVCHSLLMELC